MSFMQCGVRLLLEWVPATLLPTFQWWLGLGINSSILLAVTSSALGVRWSVHVFGEPVFALVLGGFFLALCNILLFSFVRIMLIADINLCAPFLNKFVYGFTRFS